MEDFPFKEESFDIHHNNPKLKHTKRRLNYTEALKSISATGFTSPKRINSKV